MREITNFESWLLRLELSHQDLAKKLDQIIDTLAQFDFIKIREDLELIAAKVAELDQKLTNLVNMLQIDEND